MLGSLARNVFGANSFLTPLGPIAEAERTHLIRVIGITMWGVPILIICILGFWLWHHTVRFDPYKPLGDNPLQNYRWWGWKWLFIYPEQGVASVGELAIPVDRPVSLTLTTDTVMQSFMVSALAG